MPVLDLWHGTNETFETFDTGLSFGTHFGSLRAAQERMGSTGRAKLSNGANASPHRFQVTISRALYMPDLGTWAFSAVVRQLQCLKVMNSRQVDQAYVAWNRSDREGWACVKDVMRLAGYDGVVYTNEVEDLGTDSWIALESSQIAMMEAGSQVPRDRSSSP